MDVRADGWRAATWRERLRFGPSDPATAGAEERHAFWSTHRWVAANRDRVADRLALLGIDPDGFPAMLDEEHAGFVERVSGGIPAWLEVDEVTALLGPAVPPPAADGELPDLLTALLDLYRGRLRAALAPVLRDLEAPERSVLASVFDATAPRERLAADAGRALVLELNVAREQGRLKGDDPGERFRSFLDLAATGGFRRQFWAEYPVLMRALTRTGRAWVANTTRLAARFLGDRALLRETGLLPADAGDLRRVEFGMGDPHRGGETVAILHFAGTKLVYKPRPLAVDVAFHEVLARLAAYGLPHELRTPALLDRGEYGWCEFVAAGECDSEQAVQDFYRRLGSLLAVFHALRATDLHMENIIAAGAHPIVVDLETLFDPPASIPDDPAGEALSASIVRTMLVPGQLLFRDGAGELQKVDLSALGAVAGQPVPARVLDLVGAGTDQVRMVGRPVVTAPYPNLPSLGGRQRRPAQYGAELRDGFRAGYQAVVAARRELLAPGGPLTAFQDARMRTIISPTRVYLRLLSQCLHPDFLRDGRDREVLFDRLWNHPGAWLRPELVQAEIDQLVDGDVPVFEFRPSRMELVAGNGAVIPNYFPRRPYDVVVDHLLTMGEEDRAVQERVLDLAMATMGDPEPANAAGAGRREQLVVAASAIADRLLELRISGDGTSGWIGLRRHGADIWTVEPAGLRLDSGLTGIGLFLARLALVTGRQDAMDVATEIADRLATRAPQDIADRLAGRPSSDEPDRSGVGFFGSAMGAAYFLTACSGWAGEDRWHGAVDALTAYTVDLCAGARSMTVIDGTAGAVLGILAAAPAIGQARAVARAEAVADRLVDQWLADGDSHPRTAEGGIGEGPAGIALAMSRLAVHRPEPRYAKVAHAALTVTADCGTDGGWGWHAGLAGIGLAADAVCRDAALPASELACAQRVKETARTALANRWRRPAAPVRGHGLAGGAVGELLALHVLSDASGDDRAWAATLLGELAAARRWRCDTPGAVETPGLFTGLAGIGAALLMVADPGEGDPLLTLAAPTAGRAVR